MGIEGNGCESSHASGYSSKKGSYHDLACPGLSQALEEHTLGFDIQGLDHHHHDDDQTCDKYGVAQCVCQ